MNVARICRSASLLAASSVLSDVEVLCKRARTLGRCFVIDAGLAELVIRTSRSVSSESGRSENVPRRFSEDDTNCLTILPAKDPRAVSRFVLDLTLVLT